MGEPQFETPVSKNDTGVNVDNSVDFGDLLTFIDQKGTKKNEISTKSEILDFVGFPVILAENARNQLCKLDKMDVRCLKQDWLVHMAGNGTINILNSICKWILQKRKE